MSNLPGYINQLRNRVQVIVILLNLFMRCCRAAFEIHCGLLSIERRFQRKLWFDPLLPFRIFPFSESCLLFTYYDTKTDITSVTAKRLNYIYLLLSKNDSKYEGGFLKSDLAISLQKEIIHFVFLKYLHTTFYNTTDLNIIARYCSSTKALLEFLEFCGCPNLKYLPVSIGTLLHLFSGRTKHRILKEDFQNSINISQVTVSKDSISIWERSKNEVLNSASMSNHLDGNLSHNYTLHNRQLICAMLYTYSSFNSERIFLSKIPHRSTNEERRVSYEKIVDTLKVLFYYDN